MGRTCQLPQVQAELRRWWRHRRMGKVLQDGRHTGSHVVPAPHPRGPPSEKLLLSTGSGSNGASQDPSAETCVADDLPGLAECPC